MGLNLSVVVSESARRHPDRPALLADGQTFTYRAVEDDSDQLAAGMRAVGIGPGHAVALLLPNGASFVTAYLGTLKAGGTVVPLNPLLRAAELEHCLSDSGATALITGPGEAAAALPVAEKLGVPRRYVAGEHVPDDARPLRALYAESRSRAPAADTSPGDTALLLYTSGTTGRPKGARLTHSGLLWIAHVIATDILDLASSDVLYAALPLSHIFGINAVLNVGLLAGASVLIEPRFDPDRALLAMAEHHVSMFPGVPTMAISLLAAHQRNPVPLPGLRVALLGGQAVPPEVRDAFTRTFGCSTIEAYGISEASSAVAATSSGPVKPGSVGKPVWGTDVLIADEGGSPCAAGEPGEILIRGVGLMAGYHNLPAETAQAMRGGWFRTGDIGRLDADGDLFVMDRKKDMIIRGGYNVYPREVEDVLYTHPDVFQAAVLGVPHPTHGEEVAAAIRLRPGASATADELREHARQRLAAYKYPRLIAFYEELPASSTGKLLKRAIDPEVLRRLADEQAAGPS
jgi:long-chain acyl-CoA synthetase